MEKTLEKPQVNNYFKQLVQSLLFEIIRNPKLLFHIMIFPIALLGLFWGMGALIPSSGGMDQSFNEFIFPGMLVFALMTIGLLGTSVPIIEMREKGVLKLFQVTPLSTFQFILCNIVVRIILSFIQIGIFLLIGLVFGIIKVGVFIPVLLLCLLGILLMLTLGFFFGSVFRSAEIASGVLSFLIVPILFISGVLLPFSIIPEFIKTVSMILPFVYLGDALRQVMLSSDGEFPLYLNILMLFSFSLIFLLLTIKVFKFHKE
ncbi:ABC transporter permease [Bacillus horti]|uniref:ABC-2 type transport system permease protein n=1 Tax=Caldalkalibacillus horti TaxID=77523 RepID=A0ABT9W3F7_9BACI|nr:ABC transporter permease [Bacillus horti]MDQ0167785.1 ABC-2 type transport system permease protein [Bacillus horti]